MSVGGHSFDTDFDVGAAASLYAKLIRSSRETRAMIGMDDAAAEVLIEHGADLDATNDSGTTALMTAALFGQAEIAERLVEAGADRSVTDDKGLTAAAIARRQGREDLASLLTPDAE
jgi:ankyrin repeat protein